MHDDPKEPSSDYEEILCRPVHIWKNPAAIALVLSGDKHKYASFVAANRIGSGRSYRVTTPTPLSALHINKNIVICCAGWELYSSADDIMLMYKYIDDFMMRGGDVRRIVNVWKPFPDLPMYNTNRFSKFDSDKLAERNAKIKAKKISQPARKPGRPKKRKP